MSLVRKVAGVLPDGLLQVAVHRELYAPRTPRSRPIALVYGNCQAEAVRRILGAHEAFAGQYQLLRVPAVHELTPRQLALLQRKLPAVDVLITQEIKNDYRGLELGTEQLVARLRPDARVVRYPVAFYEGLHPFLAYINLGSPVAVSAPVTDYHDVRTIHAAERGWDVEKTVSWMREFEVDPEWVRQNSERSLAEIRRREARLDVRLSGLIADPQIGPESFWTINHPANRLVTEIARQTLETLGVAGADSVLAASQTYLDHLMAPRETQVLTALGLDPSSSQPDWIVKGETVPLRDVVTAHFAQYAQTPALIPAGVAKHAERLQALGLGASA